MDGWITFWTWMCVAGLGSFAILVVFLIPLGARDLVALLRELGRDPDASQDGEP